MPFLLPALVLLAVAALVAVVMQAGLPRLAERRIATRLTESGGSAEVRVDAMPALRLLRNRGDRLLVRGGGLTIGLTGGSGSAGLGALDGFGEVDIELVDLAAGPFDVAAFVLVRRAGGPYAMAAEGSVSGAGLARIGEGWFREMVPGGALISSVAGTVPIGSRRLPVAIEVELHSEAGGLRVGSGGGRVAGYPAGPIATAIAAAVARRLEIAA
ncbi:MAG: hypothetical protein KDB46_01310 [Solirubrobacterales bacterium]|nr:hypothetical protein [Solirubrobacterales bacterium]